MKANLPVVGALVIVVLLSASPQAAAESNSWLDASAAVFTTIDFVPNIETMGVAVSGNDLTPTADLVYRKSGETAWHTGHPLMPTDDGRLVGSLFNLSAATSYEIQVLDGASTIGGTVSTQPDQLSFMPSILLHVDDDALPGGDGSATAPFRTIQEAVNHASPGTQVLVADGIYREAITFPNAGSAGNWIQVKAEGNAAILDSADRLSGSIWTGTSTAKVWFTKIGGPVAYLARGENRFYQYDDKNGLMQAKGHAGVTINEGWYYEAGTQRLYVRSLDNPINYAWRVPRLNHAFDIGAREWIWIEGFEIRFYGTTTNGCGVCSLNASHIVIRKNKIHNMQLGIFINWNGTPSQGNDTRIEGNEVYDPLVNEWPWASTKGSYMEGTGIIIRGHIGAIVRDNHVHNFFNGIYTGSSGALENSELAFDADIYNNHIHHVSDDGLEPEGACINQRFRNNTVDRSFIGISLAPITQGPTWVLRNTFTNFTGRGIKFADNSDGIVLIYHNTAWTTAANINGADLITSIHNVKLRNNIFQTAGYSFYEVPTGSTGNDWNHDNWYTTRGSTGPHFKWENVNYNTISALCAASGMECNGYDSPPGFTNPAGGDFTLLSSSPNVDRGVVISGINDNFLANAPDAGAYEFVSGPPPIVVSSVRADADPTSAATVNFIVTFSEPITGVDEFAPFNDFILSTDSGLTGTAITGVRPVSGSIYRITVNTGVGVGTLRLDVVDDNSIKDAANRPLGGLALGDGNFTSGEVYGINRPPNVDVRIAGNLAGKYFLAQSQSTRQSYTIDSGPLEVDSTDGFPILSSERFIYSFQDSRSYAEMMGYPGDQLATDYWFPWYNNVSYSTQLRVSNLGSNNTEVKVYAGSNTTLVDTFTVSPGQGVRTSYNMDTGPLHVVSSDGTTPILVSERFIQTFMNSASYSEMIGYPGDQLATEYWFPWYNNLSYSTQLRVSNIGGTNAEVKVYAGNTTTPIDTFMLQAGEGIRTSYTIDSGPLRVVSTDGVTPILVSERFIQTYMNSASYAEMMGYPGDQLATGYCFPWYNNTSDGAVALSSQLRVSNMGNTGAQVKVYLAGVEKDSFTLLTGQGARKSYPAFNDGFLCVISGNAVPILASERFISTYQNSSSYSEMMGYPTDQPTTSYWFPWYNNLSYSTELRIAKP